MFRLALAGAGSIVLAVAAAYLIPWSLAAPYLPGVGMMPVLSAIALVISLVAAAAALRALHHVAQLRKDVHLLARSIDMALGDVLARTDREAATIGEMTISVAREVDRLSEKVARRDDGGAAVNVIQHPSARKRRGASPLPETSPASADAKALEAAYRDAVAVGTLDIALQPIVSVSRGAAAGFEAFASLPVEGGQRIELRRPADPAARTEAAAFERILVIGTLQAGRRRLGAASESMPLHVGVSDALLADGKELATLLDTLQFYPDLAKSLVLSLPVGTIGARHEGVLDLLASKGIRLACEGWNEAANSAEPTAAGLSYLKIAADRLLDRERPRHKPAPASTIIEQAAARNLSIIATNVASDEDAVNLIDLGIDLMSGPRFGGPKRLRPEDGAARPGRFAQTRPPSLTR